MVFLEKGLPSLTLNYGWKQVVLTLEEPPLLLGRQLNNTRLWDQGEPRNEFAVRGSRIY